MSEELREKVIKSFEECLKTPRCQDCPWESCERVDCARAEMPYDLVYTGLALLKAQELPDVKPEKLEERTTKWLDQMTAEERLKEIAAILDDWDGYRTAKGLGGLINEVWAYALYPVKAQEPAKPYIDSDGRDVWRCGNCGAGIFHPEHTQADEDERNYNKFCRHCGMAVKWKLDKPPKEET